MTILCNTSMVSFAIVFMSSVVAIKSFVLPASLHLRPSLALSATKEEVAKILEKNEKESDKFFTGGAFDKMDPEAAKIASRFKTVRDLGWTNKDAKIRGNARPRHRAFGGEGEKPVQLKPNYDDSKAKCVEKWLTQEDFYAKVKNEGPAADTVFCALAGGGAFAERSICESKLEQWRPNGKFDEAAFVKSVNEGRTTLAIGWAIYSSVLFTAALGIVAPTNPFMKALESGVDVVRDSAGLSYDASLLGIESFFM